MRTTTWECDRCGKDCPEGKEIFDVEVGVRWYGNLSKARAAEWCRECLTKTGLSPAAAKELSITPEPFTLEDMIREIVREEVAQGDG